MAVIPEVIGDKNPNIKRLQLFLNVSHLFHNPPLEVVENKFEHFSSSRYTPIAAVYTRRQ